MAKFIKLSTINDTVYINMDLIESMSRDGSMTNLYYQSDDSQYYRVMETPEEILELIRAAE